MNRDEPEQTEPSSEAKLAIFLRNKVRDHLMIVIACMDEARAKGLIINFSIGQDQFGGSSLQALNVMKKLA